ncbi:hypothetical protein [Enterovibrio norvegicus]|uniref:hypothetical protein n=1 Tax=Enterovibrio norvegicus TaxID=188144 RepID=UPI00352CB6BB
MNLLGRYTTVFFIPLFIQFLLLAWFYNIPTHWLESALFLPLMLFTIGFVFDSTFRRGFSHQNMVGLNPNCHNQNVKVVVFSFAVLVVILMPMDIALNGLKILKPETYAQFHPIGRFVRHITNFCWVLIPFAFFYLRGKNLVVSILFILALTFPIIIVDRNRFLLSCFCLIYLYYFNWNTKSCSNPFKSANVMLFTFVSLILLVFSLVGVYRSGTAFIVETSGNVFIEGAFPLKDNFGQLPPSMQQVILYVTTPLLNFTTILVEYFKNTDFLLSQLAPFNREQFSAYPFSPILVQRFNVGTEFFPFLLYGGKSLVVLAGMLTSLYFVVSVKLHEKYCNIFTFLIYIKSLYSILLIGFAPQIIILYNLASIILILILWICSVLMKPYIKKSAVEYGTK